MNNFFSTPLFSAGIGIGYLHWVDKELTVSNTEAANLVFKETRVATLVSTGVYQLPLFSFVKWHVAARADSPALFQKTPDTGQI